MRCLHCGHEIKEQEIYCSFCGETVQMVPDYNVLEDELLPELLSGEQKPVGETSSKEASIGADDKKPEEKSKGRKGKRWIPVIVLAVVLLLGAGGAIYYVNSEAYRYKQAEKLEKKGDYEGAIKAYLSLEEKSDPIRAELALSSIYIDMEDYEKAEETLLRALAASPDNETIYEALLKLYRTAGDMEAILALADTTENAGIIEMIASYSIASPRFSDEEGSYTHDLSLSLSSPDGYDIYYTTDGTDPTSHNGILYEEAIAIEGGRTTVKAVCVDDDDNYGAIVQATYTVSYEAPAMPTASPTSGTFHDPTFVTITSESAGGTVYYTWDGSIPTKDSEMYTGPIEIPEGNHILSVIVIDRYGMTSDILRCNYVYLP